MSISSSGSIVRRVVASVVVLTAASAVVAQPVVVESYEKNIRGAKIRGLTATVDLSDPQVQIVVTEPRTDGGTADALLKPTDDWRIEVGAHLAINANYFGTINATEADIVGLSMSDGQIVSNPRTFNGNPDPAMIFTANGAQVGNFGLGDLAGATEAVAGVGPSTTDTDPGTLLVQDGVNLGATARVQPDVRNPRTAVGVSADGQTLYIAVIDGRQDSWSIGITLPELGDLMIDLGADDAINLDGGGSSSLVADIDGVQHENRPSDGDHRAVANHLGVVIGEPAAPPPAEQIERPIRGAWLRPPSNTLLTDDVLDKFAEAGGTDLFLETFYHGLATHDSDVFNDRFATDVLADVMDRAHKRGIRVHAWLEAAYWSFGGSGNYILNQHPEWKVVDDEGGTDIGDISGQVFVNIGNPGVQAMLADLCTELATNYPLLWGLHTDYHRFPLDNDGADGQLAPYSFDAWSRAEFQSIYGVDPLVSARLPGDPFYDEFVEWRRLTLGLAAKAMNDAMVAADPGKMFSGAIFATAIADRFCTPNLGQLVKMQDWPTWAANGWLPVTIPMAYGSSTTSIRNDIRAANNQAINPCGTSGNAEPNTRIVAGLAIINPTSRPGIVDQLDTIYNEGVTSFVWFEANALVVSQANIDDMRNYILTNGPFESGDFDTDADIDADDWDFFFTGFTGTPFQSAGPLDLTGDNLVDFDDQAEFLRQFRTFRFGEDGDLGAEEYAGVVASFTDPSETWPRHLFDLTGDGVVDCADVQRMRTILTGDVTLDVNPDVDADGFVTATDLNAFLSLHAGVDPRTDLTGDGSYDFLDIAAYQRAVETACP